MTDNPSATAPRTRSESKPYKLEDNIKIALVEPITVDGAAIESVTVKRLKVHHRMSIMRRYKEQADIEMAYIVEATGLAPDVVEAMDIADYMAINEVVEGFFTARRTI